MNAACDVISRGASEASRVEERQAHGPRPEYGERGASPVSYPAGPEPIPATAANLINQTEETLTINPTLPYRRIGQPYGGRWGESLIL